MKINELFESAKSVMYHGTNHEFDWWNLSAERSNRGTNVTGVYFTPRRYEAAGFGHRIIEAEVTYRNPFYGNSGRRNNITPQMIRKAREQLLKFTGYKEHWLDSVILPSIVEKGLDAIVDVSGDIKREILLAGGYDAYIDGDHVVILEPNTQNIKIIK